MFDEQELSDDFDAKLEGTMVITENPCTPTKATENTVASIAIFCDALGAGLEVFDAVILGKMLLMIVLRRY